MREAIAGMVVGGGAAEIMRQFLDGWNQAQTLDDIAGAMAESTDVAAAIGPVTTSQLISIAVELYDRYGAHLLSAGQVDTLERLRPHAHPPDDRLPTVRPWDVVATAVTAMQLADRYGLPDPALWEVIDRARPHIT
ncbi:hypothetical protein [Nocardia salmonicida]|uniref:hypothetical protein n=1 Tax=Nocardia salmonicida TaxID=53431 RepID=UPI0033C8ACB6